MKEKSKEVISCLKNEKILVQYKRKTGGIYDKAGNPAVGGMHENALFVLSAPVDIDGSYKKILTDDELEFLQTVIDSDISFKNKEFWRSRKVALNKKGVTFNLMSPMDYVNYKIAEAWSNSKFVSRPIIARSPDLLDGPNTFKFVIVKPDEVAKTKRQGFDKRKAAYMLIGKFQDNKDILRYLYYATTKDKRIASDSQTNDDLVIYFGELIERSPAEFTNKAEDKYLETKGLLFAALCDGVIKSENKELYFQGKKLADSDDTATLDTAAIYISHPTRQTIKFSIEGALTEQREK